MIARILPGAATILLLVVLELPGSDLLQEMGLLSGASLVVVSGLSYILALLLTPVGGLTGVIIWFFLHKVPPLEMMSPLALWERIDKIEDKKPQMASTLSKMAAEMTLSENLLAGVVTIGLLLPLSNLGRSELQFSARGLACLGLLLVINIGFRNEVLSRRLLVHKTDLTRTASPAESSESR